MVWSLLFAGTAGGAVLIGARSSQFFYNLRGHREGVPPPRLLLWPPPVIVGLLARLSRSRAQARMQSAVLELVTGLAAELRAGQPAGIALERAAESLAAPICPHSLAAVRLGGDVPRALTRDGHESGLPLLRSLAALWSVAQGSGAGLAAGVDRLARTARAGGEVRRELAAQLAGPKATAKVLAGLPAFGMLLASGLGASPVSWLLGTPLGFVVLCAGLALEVVGLWWTHRLISAVQSKLS